jgi:hypothetical protein
MGIQIADLLHKTQERRRRLGPESLEPTGRGHNGACVLVAIKTAATHWALGTGHGEPRESRERV